MRHKHNHLSMRSGTSILQASYGCHGNLSHNGSALVFRHGYFALGYDGTDFRTLDANLTSWVNHTGCLQPDNLRNHLDSTCITQLQRILNVSGDSVNSTGPFYVGSVC